MPSPYDDTNSGNTCDFCGDRFVTWRSHKLFCQGLDKRPWLILPPNPDRIDIWSTNKEFIEWAKLNNIKVEALVSTTKM